jgi:hypothetical protein
MPGQKRIEFIRPVPCIDNEYDPTGRGSCVASKVAGPKFGVAKDANIVMIKVPDMTWFSDMLWALAGIYGEASQRKLAGKAVVNLSLDCKYINPSIGESGLTSTPVNMLWFHGNPSLHDSFRIALNKLIESDVVIIAASGNDRVRAF